MRAALERAAFDRDMGARATFAAGAATVTVLGLRPGLFLGIDGRGIDGERVARWKGHFECLVEQSVHAVFIPHCVLLIGAVFDITQHTERSGVRLDREDEQHCFRSRYRID